MELLNVFFIILGVLQIVLLVKIWIMTSDVAKIKNKLPSKDRFIKQAKIAAMEGRTEEAEKSYKEAFWEEVYELGSRSGGFPHEYKIEYSTLKEKYENLVKDVDFEKYDTLKKYYSYK